MTNLSTKYQPFHGQIPLTPGCFLGMRTMRRDVFHKRREKCEGDRPPFPDGNGGQILREGNFAIEVNILHGDNQLYAVGHRLFKRFTAQD